MAVGMTFSNLVMFAVIVATAQTLHSHHITNIASAAQAAEALKPFAGHFASALFALGFVGSGLCHPRARRVRLGRHGGAARQTVGLLALGPQGPALRPGRRGDARGHRGQPPARQPDQLLVFVAVINGVAAAPFVFVVMWVSSSKRLMGDYVNGKIAKVLGWLTAR